MSRIYITTAIPYVNAAPHIGHALELVQVDALRRAWTAQGHDVRALTGTDDNALKNAQAARAAGVPVGDFVRTNGDRFIDLAGPLGLEFDDVIRTGSDPRHAPGVERLWRACAAAGDLYRRDYVGRYCVGCEAFLDDTDLDQHGRCREHLVAPEDVRENNWFFRLSRFGNEIALAITTGRLRIEPISRRNEVLATLAGGLRDISVSRSAERADGWGLAVPDDPAQVVYVWFDALANYLTALGAGDDEARWWTGADERIHVVGKGILRFHAIYWPAILASANLPWPTAVFVHDYLTVDGQKISKGLGNGVDPVEVAHAYGADSLRWWLLRDAPLGVDTDFTAARLVARANDDLANGFGNLISRTVALTAKLLPELLADVAIARVTDDEIESALAEFDFRRATRRLRTLVDIANGELERVRPWELAARNPHDPAIAAVLANTVERCRTLTWLLSPFAPAVSRRAEARLRGGAGSPIFSKLVSQ